MQYYLFLEKNIKKNPHHSCKLIVCGFLESYFLFFLSDFTLYFSSLTIDFVENKDQQEVQGALWSMAR